MKPYQMIRMKRGPYRGERGQIVPPLPRGGKGKYCVQFTDTSNTFRVHRTDFILLNEGEIKRFS